MIETLSKPQIIHLNVMPKDGRVWVDGNDGGMLMTVDQVLRACKLYSNLDVGVQEVMPVVKSLWSKIVDWLIAQGTVVKGASLSTNPDGRIFLLVTQKGNEFNPELSDKLSDLDLEIANSEEFALIKLSVRLIPENLKEAEALSVESVND